jgi:transposase InsO family protein
MEVAARGGAVPGVVFHTDQGSRVHRPRLPPRVRAAGHVGLQLRHDGIEVARCTVARLMKELGIAGVSARRKKPRTTVPGSGQQRPADLLGRDFSAPEPNRRRVADITYVDTFRRRRMVRARAPAGSMSAGYCCRLKRC